MIEFGRYYISFLRELLEIIGNFFRNIFEAIAIFFSEGLFKLIQNFIMASINFTILDWFIYIIVMLINIVFIAVIVVLITRVLKKYIKFTKQEIEKDELVAEIDFLNRKTMELLDEKNKILALKVSNLGINPDQDDELLEPEIDESKFRFVKLLQVDLKYENVNPTVNMIEVDKVSLEGLVDRFINYSASRLKLYYSKKIIYSFFAGMAASKTMILEGISGTGKTSLPYAMGKFFGHDSNIIPVQPSWRDRAEMIGYLNEFTKKFNETDFLKAIYETTYRKDISIIVLDEMNLARVEYYFAELLSLLEMPDQSAWLVDVVPDTKQGDPKNIINGKLLIPGNVWFIGTANKDDSTFTITDKVYDRATPIEINTKSTAFDAPATDGVRMSHDYLNLLFENAYKDNPMTLKTMENLEHLDYFITKNFKVTFGNRIMKQIRSFVPVYVACGGTELEALDFMVVRKIFRKFEGLNLPFLQQEISDLSKLIERLFGKNAFSECQNYLSLIKKQF